VFAFNIHFQCPICRRYYVTLTYYNVPIKSEECKFKMLTIVETIFYFYAISCVHVFFMLHVEF